MKKQPALLEMKCRLLYTSFYLTIIPINPLFIQFENHLKVQAGHR